MSRRHGFREKKAGSRQDIYLADLNEPYEPQIDNPAEKPAKEQTKELTEEPAKELAEGLTEGSAEEPAKELTEEPAKELAEELTEGQAEGSAEEPAKELTEEPAKELAEELTEGQAEGSAEEPAKELRVGPAGESAEEPAGPETVLCARNVTKYYRTARGETVHAVEGVSLSLVRGETLALVGESGCGKSTLARAMIRMLPITSGEVLYRGREISAMKEKEFRPMRRSMQMVFQDPGASLDPRKTVRDIIAEPLKTWHVCRGGKQTTERVLELMEKTGVPADFLRRYPHQFSGGQRQRIGIARAIALDPEILICDEPVSALDVSVQSQVLNLLKRLQKDMKLTTLFIGHDLSVIHFIADRVAVMFLGHICEVAPKDALFGSPLHPYTEFLIDAIPQADPHRRDEPRKVLQGDIPSPVHPPSGCCFHPRCPHATARCSREVPELRYFGQEHYAACHQLP